jgi:pyruvate dehydrogenase E2 component (dihydrolipoamide acetyltransferase)
LATEVVFPKLGLSLEPGRVVAWHKQPGDDVDQGEPIVDVETDKVTMEVEAPAAGVLLACLAEPGQTVEIGAAIALIGAAGEELPAVTSATSSAAAELPTDPRPSAATLTQQPRLRKPVRASPVARKRARELGVDLAAVAATGPDGRVTAEDVETYATARSGSQVNPRAGIAAQVAASWSAPHINICGELLADGLVRAMQSPRLKSTDVSVTDLLVHVVASALREVPELNGTYGPPPTQGTEVHLGLAVASERGVIVPVIHDAHTLDIESIASERRRLSSASRSGSLTGADLVGGTATLSNLGAYPVDLFTPVLFGPQICLVATGRIRRQPVMQEEVLTTEHRIWINACIDHRAADGEAGGRFLAAVQERVASLA